MLAIKQFQETAKGMTDLLNWAALIDDGIVLDKDGSLMAGFYYRGSDLASATPEEKNYISARINAAMCQLGSGWATWHEAIGLPAEGYPAIMISGINSDLPGQIIGQVSENVYDSATGKHQLIPQGSRLVGTYDNSVTNGQNRVLVTWNRIIFSDGASLNLDMMHASDQSGYAGFNDKVNNHYAKTFGSALLMSIFSAGVQVSQPQATNGQNINSGQTIAGAIGQQLGQVGSQVFGRNIRVQPTLQIRPGYRFNISVTKDFIISPVGK